MATSSFASENSWVESSSSSVVEAERRASSARRRVRSSWRAVVRSCGGDEEGGWRGFEVVWWCFCGWLDGVCEWVSFVGGAEEGGWDIDRRLVGRRDERRDWIAERWLAVAGRGCGGGSESGGSMDEELVFLAVDEEDLSWWSWSS